MQPQLQHLAGRVLFDQPARRALGDDAATVHHHQPVAQLLGFVHVVRGQHQRDAALLEPVEAVPQDVAGLRVEAGGRLVEQQQVGFAHQRPGDREAALHATRQRVDAFVRSLGELHELEQLGGTTPALGAGDVEVAPVDHQVLDDGQLRVELVGLRDDAHAGADRRAVAAGSRSKIRSVPDVIGETQPIIRIVEVLPAPFGPEEAERLARRDVEVDAVDGDEVAELLAQVAGGDHRRRHRRAPYGSRRAHGQRGYRAASCPPLPTSSSVRSSPPTLDRILEINEANVPEVGSVDADRMAFLVAESPIALAVELDGTIVGFCLVLPSDSGYDSVNYRWFTERYDDFMYLDRVAFDAAAQGRGLGTLLYAEVDRLMDELAASTHLALEVNVDPPNEPSLAFHARRGFVEVGQQDTPYGIRVSMQMRLTGYAVPDDSRDRRSAAVLEEAEVVAGRGDVGGVEVGEQYRLAAGAGGEHLAERVDDRAVAGVVEPAAGADPVDADDVGLVLDRPRPQQRRPVQPSLRRPVGDDEVGVDVARPAPRTRRRSAGRSRRTARHRSPSMSTVTNVGAGADVALLVGVGERVDLAVAVLRAVGAGEHEHVRRPLVVGGRFGGDLRARAADPDAVGGRHPARNCDDGPPSGSAMSGESNENPVENVSVSSTTRAPLAAAPAIIGARRSKFAVAVVPDDVVLDRGDAHRGHEPSPRCESGGEPLDRFVDHVDALAAGEPHQVAAVFGPGVEHLVRHRHDAAALGQATAERHRRRRRLSSGRMSTVVK